MTNLKKIDNELQRRKRGRNSLIEFAHAIDVPGRPETPDPDEWLFRPIETMIAPHHALLLRTVDQVINTPQGRAMILMPPGSAKSTYCSSVLPAYVMGRQPGFRMMVTSYSTELARRHSRRARFIAKSDKYWGIFQTTLSAEASAADDWALSNGSTYIAAGIQAGLTGNRADGIVIDDPVKGRDEANSQTIRTATREAYDDDIKTRLAPGGWLILIQTRWHQDDLAGSILPADWAGESGVIRCRDGLDWTVLCLPARADRADDPLGRGIGDYLWPEYYPGSHWAEFERVPRTWNALYQQKPAPETGSYFEADWLHTCEVMPPRERLQVYAASDYAVSEKHGDYTVHIVVGLDSEERMYVLDLWRRQAKSNVWVEAACALMQQWRPVAWAEEAGQIHGGVGPFLAKDMLRRRIYVPRKPIVVRSDKLTRAQSIAGHMGVHGLYVPAAASWMPAFRAELMAFPHGKHDDQVDALSLIGQLLKLMSAPNPPPPAKPFRGMGDITFDEYQQRCTYRPDPDPRI